VLRVVAPQPVRDDHVGAALRGRAVVPVVLRPLLGLVGGAEHRRLGLAARDVRLQRIAAARDVGEIVVVVVVHRLLHLAGHRRACAHRCRRRRARGWRRCAPVGGGGRGAERFGLELGELVRAFERRGAEQRVDELGVGRRIGREDRDPIGEDAHERRLGAQPAAEQRELERV